MNADAGMGALRLDDRRTPGHQHRVYHVHGEGFAASVLLWSVVTNRKGIRSESETSAAKAMAAEP